jgi:hypothetical protein
MTLLPLLFLIIFLGTAARAAYRGQPLSGALIGLGALGFFGAALAPAAGTRLQNVELPVVFDTTTIVGPGGKIFTATAPMARIQRYDREGRFETGWFVDSAGGIFAIGLTADGRIAVASTRTKQVEFFDTDGSPTGPPRPFMTSGGTLDGVLRPSNFQVEGVTFVDPTEVDHPAAHWTTLVLFPLWHPFIAWLLVAAGMGVAWLNRRKNEPASSPRS